MPERVPGTRAWGRDRLRHGARGTAAAVAAVTLLTASGAPSLISDRGRAPSGRSEAAAAEPESAAPSPGDDSYHTELPPLTADEGIGVLPDLTQLRSQSGIPATVLAAYRRAESSVARTDAGCRLPWQLLAAIGKVESGQARGGAVTADGTTRGRITGPALDGRGFALIRDSDNGVHDGDKVYDRAVGPMQFLPGTWARWGADGNGDGLRDPDNIFDAALAAGHYLCAGDRDLGVAADLDRAVLSYNHSADYLRLVRYWLDFYRSGVHTVPDGSGVIPESPGAGGERPATKPVGGGGGIVVGPQPTASPSEPGTPTPSDPGSPGPSPTGPDRPDPTDPGPSPDPTDTGEPTPDPTDSGPGEPSGCPSPTGSPSPSDSPSPDGSPSPTGSPSPGDPDDPCSSTTPGPGPSAGT